MAISELECSKVKVEIKSLGSYVVTAGTTLYDICARIKNRLTYTVTAGVINNNLIDMNYQFYNSCEVELLDTSTETGLKIYRRSALFMMLLACRKLFPKRRLIVKHSLSNGLFCEFSDSVSNDIEVAAIERKMKEIQTIDLNINKLAVKTEDACKLFAGQEQTDKVKLLEYRNKDKVHVYEMDGFYEYFYGYMVPRTGLIKEFRIINYPPGIILQTPEINDPWVLQPYVPQEKLASVFLEAKDWAEMLQTPHLAALNDIIGQGNILDIIRVNEALHEKKIAYIADTICSNRNIRLVLISGPSSSGKTTFAQRLLIQLRVNGRRPVSISLDNYFVDRAHTPLDENGEYDFEALGALNLPLFNEHLGRLINGEEVHLPVYNFKTGISELNSFALRVPEGEPIIIEGIHGLNDKLTWSIPREQKFKIYVSALTQLNIDNTNRIPTTDSRLIRRIVRDNRTRGHGALDTIKRWPSVRRGEERNIFPFQENADVIFNSSLVYELSVLKPYVEPLLQDITEDYPEHLEAKRLLKFLSYFRRVAGDDIPSNSILREFIGGSWFKD